MGLGDKLILRPCHATHERSDVSNQMASRSYKKMNPPHFSSATTRRLASLAEMDAPRTHITTDGTKCASFQDEPINNESAPFI